MILLDKPGNAFGLLNWVVRCKQCRLRSFFMMWSHIYRSLADLLCQVHNRAWVAAILRKRKVARTEKEAVRLKNQAMADAETGRYIEPSGKRLGDYLDQWLETKKGKVDDNTWDFYESHIRNHIKPELGKVRLKDLSHKQIQDFVDKKAKTCSMTAVKRGMFVPLGQALRKATDSERLTPLESGEGYRTAKRGKGRSPDIQ